MLISSIAFLMGVLILLKWLYVINWLSIILILIFESFLCLYWVRYRRFFQFCLLVTLGVSWALFTTQKTLSWHCPSQFEGKSINVVGTIESMPEPSQFGQKFIFSLKMFNHTECHTKIKLTWSTDTSLHVGQVWQLQVKVKNIVGLYNEGSFDYEQWAFGVGISAQGTVINSPQNSALSRDRFWYVIQRLRVAITQHIQSVLKADDTSVWIIALVTGMRGAISPDEWQVLRNTGTNHLMAIAGLHIGLVSSLMHSGICFLCRKFPRITFGIPAHFVGAGAALLSAIIYSALAGFSLPAQRATFMITYFIIGYLSKRHIDKWHAYGLGLFCVLLCNPCVVLTISFWLSFGTVAFILYGLQNRLNASGWWWKYGRVQYVISLGLIPVSLYCFGEVSLISIIANAISIPIVGFIVVPLSLVGSFAFLLSTHLAKIILTIANAVLAVNWKILVLLAHFKGAVWVHHVGFFAMVSGIIGVFIWLSPRFLLGKYFALGWFLPLLFTRAPTPKANEAWFTLLDVGQGLSAVVRTQHHVLVFDTGAKSSEQYDMGRMVVGPYLAYFNIHKIDTLIISHGDNDHSGGAPYLINQFAPNVILTSVPQKFSTANYCLQGQRWQWDGVTFEMLYPDKAHLNLNNNSSCVLKVTAPDKTILITGDIQKLAEQTLLAQNIKADILIVPHHGSKTSSTDAFVQAVSPAWVLYSIGYRNRYHLPNVKIVEKYERMVHAKSISTISGQINFTDTQTIHRSYLSSYDRG